MSKIWFLGDSYVAQKRTAKSWTVNVQEAFPEYDNEILANKVIRHIKTNEPIDLTTEWEYT